MFLTNEWFEPNIFHAKTMVCGQLYVNDGNNKKPHSHARSHGNCLNNKTILKQCERVNSFSCVYVRNYFLIPFSISFRAILSVFIFFLFACVNILLFTHSHLNKINIKTMAYHVNDLKNSFPSHSHDSHEG